MKIKFISLFVSIFIASFAFGQTKNRIYEGHKELNGQLEVYTSDGKYIFKPYTIKIMETSFIPEGETFNPKSHAVVLTPENLRANLIEDEENLIYSTQGIRVSIKKSPFQVSYDFKGQALISEKGGYIKTDSTEILEFNLTEEEILYGGGARVLGMNRRGNRLELYNRAHYGYTTHSSLMNYTIPLVLSSKIYAVHFDNAPIGFLDLDSKGNNTLIYETISGRKTYQIVAGESWPDLIDQYTDLTGKQPLPPRWAFGNFSSRFGYHTEKETRETVNKFLEDKIPLDAVVIDIYWFGADIKGHMGNFEFLTDSFPSPEKMIADFAEKGVKTILVTEPFILTTSKKWDEAVEKELLGTDSLGNPYIYDFYFGNTGLIDIYKPEAHDWFWDFYKTFTNKGVAGWWGDLGEPEVHPSGLQHAIGSADEVHNIYGHNWAELIYEGYRKDFPNQRPFILMRAGYSGSQKFGLIPWSGDVERSWGGLQPQTEIALQMGMQGVGYMHSDLGGFAGGEVFTPELYTRWLQYGVFQPIYRPHAQEHIAAEPVFHDDKTKAIAKKAIELRYQLLPYNYTLAFENNQSGMPFMRPLFFEEPENTELMQMAETYLWGNDFLISPVVDSGLMQQEIYFPANHNWFDFYSDKKYKGGQSYTVDLSPKYIPAFVRGGAFIPMVETVQTTRDYSTADLILHYYFDGNTEESKGQLYDDDGITPEAYEKGEYELLQFSSKFQDMRLLIQLTSSIGSNYDGLDRNIQLMIHHLDNEPPSLKADGKDIDFSWESQNKILSVKIFWKVGIDQEIEIEF